MGLLGKVEKLGRGLLGGVQTATGLLAYPAQIAGGLLGSVIDPIQRGLFGYSSSDIGRLQQAAWSDALQQREIANRAAQMKLDEMDQDRTTGEKFGAVLSGQNPGNVDAMHYNAANQGDPLQMVVQQSRRSAPDAMALQGLAGTQSGARVMEGHPMLKAMMMPQKLGPGDVVASPIGGTLLANPKDATTPSDVAEYNFYAQQESGMGRAPLPYNDWRLQGRRAGASQINVNPTGPQLGTPPSGYYRPNPTQPGLQEEPNGPRSAERQQKWRDATSALDDADAAFRELNNVLQEVGKLRGVVDGASQGRLQTAFGNARSAIRILYNTGVLQPGELPMLNQALNDPSSLQNLLDPRSRPRLQAQIAELLNSSANRRRNISAQYGYSPSGIDKGEADFTYVPGKGFSNAAR